MMSTDSKDAIEARCQELFEIHQREICTRTDRIFAILMPLQWAAAIGGALWISPFTWSGDRYYLHPHVYLAIIFGGLLCSLPTIMALTMSGNVLTRNIIALAQVMFSSLLIHIAGGRPETHFHIFGSFAFLAAYRDWKLLIPPTILVALDHYLRGAFWPQSVFGEATANSWRWLEHGGWVVFEVLFLVISARLATKEMRAMARQRTELEVSHRELGQAKELAEAANAAKSEFLANMSHEIRTPLSAILGFTDVLRRNMGQPEQREQYLATIQSSGNHLLTLINDILDLSKIESGHMEFERKRCSPHGILTEVLSVMRVRAQEKALNLEYEWLTPIPETILTDPARFRQAVVNLTANAIKFTESGTVTVRIAAYPEQSEPRFVCEVQDTGVGIPEAFLDRVFMPFHQVDNSNTRKFGGTGLGLSISQYIVEKLGGKITVESQLGKGSLFRATFQSGSLAGIPMLAEKPVDPCQCVQNLSRGAIQKLRPIRVLLADDGVSNRDLISLVLTEAGTKVTCVENGQQAVERALAESFDLILMDMQMPVMDGYTATSLLRTMNVRVPIVALTAHAMRGDADKCLRMGCSGYVSKPIQIDRLLQVINDTVGGPASSSTNGIAKTQDSVTAPSSQSAARGEKLASPIRSTLPIELPRFRDIINGFAVTLVEKTEEMQSAFDSKEWDRLAKLAHWLKGSGGTAGFDCLTIPSSNLEKMARREDSQAQSTLDEIRGLAKRIKSAAI